MSNAQRGGRQSKFWPGVFLGSLIGVGLGMLFAPRPGAETRERLAEQTAGLVGGGQTMQGGAGGLWDTFDEVREIVHEAIVEGRAVLREAIDEARKASARTEEDMRHRYGQATKQEPESEDGATGPRDD